MAPRAPVVVTAVLCLAAGVAAVGTANPPAPGTDDNGLTENESATLWSRDADNYTAQSAYRRRYGESRTAMQQLANGTDITFTRPPATAATWTRNDFADLHAGGPTTSVSPSGATLKNGTLIADAHATIFAAQPSTRGHLAPNETVQYLAPNGTLRGFVDYRVRRPNASPGGTGTTEWSIASHEIETVRLLRDGEPIVDRNGTHTPTLQYDLRTDGQVTVTLEATIHVRLRGTVRDNGTGAATNTTVRTETLTVRDSLTAEVYDLSASVYYAEYANGDTGVAVFQTRPWQGYTLTANESPRVRGVWRFYTARDTSWDTLTRTNGTATETVASDAVPVFVHAYPSRIGPRAEPVRDGPTILETWGTTAASPAPTLGENITIDVVHHPYTASYGVAVRAARVDPGAINIGGIVRGVNASITEPNDGFERPLTRSNLTATIREQTQSGARVRVTLRTADRGEPIVLDDSARDGPTVRPERTGYITIAGQRVETNASGVAVVTVDQPGIYTVRYHPESWVSQSSAYVGDTATVRWHPLTTLDGWVALLLEVGWQLLPFVVALYAGRRLLALLSPAGRYSDSQ
ncbi:hypothetical protein [Halolamina sediminis]|uniref:hypothetical protein n=1 Tax=Halolamina sediminis TaxID=1480675 RepID=UPI0006B4881C|nr:hypothetical protein [Halolamina sediminis]